MWLLDVCFYNDDNDGAGVRAHIPLKQSRADTTLAAKSLISFTGGPSKTNVATWSGGNGQTYSLVSPQLSFSPLPLTLYLTGLMNLSAAQGKLKPTKPLTFTDRSGTWELRGLFLCSDQNDEVSGQMKGYFRAMFGFLQLEMLSFGTCRCRWFRCVLRLNAVLVALVHEGSFQERPPCMPGRLMWQ